MQAKLTVKIRRTHMTEIYLIRHVQAEGNLYRVMQGHFDGAVTALKDYNAGGSPETCR